MIELTRKKQDNKGQYFTVTYRKDEMLLNKHFAHLTRFRTGHTIIDSFRGVLPQRGPIVETTRSLDK